MDSSRPSLKPSGHVKVTFPFLSYRNENGKSDDMIGKDLFYVGYQNHETICFTRKSNDRPGSFRLKDILTLRRMFLIDTSYNEAELQIFIHLPNQLLRSFDVPSFKAKFDQIKSWNMRVELHISHVTILRKREASNDPCDDKIQNDDQKMMKVFLATD